MMSPAYLLNRWTSNRWFAVGLLLLMTVLLTMVAVKLDGGAVTLQPLHSKPDPVERLVPVKRIEQLSLNLAEWPVEPFANGRHPFFTAHFKPPPPPPEPIPVVKPEPPPPVPAVKKINLLYQGVYQTADGRNQAFLLNDGKLSVVAVGAMVVENWGVAEIGKQKLTLTNQASETTILEFNREKTMEIPVK